MAFQSQRPRNSPKLTCGLTLRVLRGGRSFGIARHWHPVLKIYMIPFITSRTSTWRLLPPRLAGGINAVLGSTAAASPLAARAQQAERMRRIGVLMATAEDDPETKP